jgi:hypothetical protein
MAEATTAENSPEKKVFQRPVPGKYRMEFDQIPPEIKDLAKQKLGDKATIAPARENGNYKGSVMLNSEQYLVQAIGKDNKAAIVHRKEDIELVSQNLQWRDQEKRLGSVNVAVYYKGEKANVFPWNKEREADQILYHGTMKHAHEYAGNNFKAEKERTKFLSHVEKMTTERIEQRKEASQERKAGQHEATQEKGQKQDRDR